MNYIPASPPDPIRTVFPMTANQEFSRLVREVERGEGFPIARRHRPIAKLLPHTADKAADPGWRRPIGGFVSDWPEAFEVSPAGSTALVDAMPALAERRLSLRDALLRAAARQAGCSAVVTEDMQHGRPLGGVEFIDPFAADALTLMAPMLDP